MRVVWQSPAGVKNAESLLLPHAGQAVLKEPQPLCMLTAASQTPAGVLLDFGRELHGYIELITPMTKDQAKLRHVRVRFGESVSEAMAEPGGPQNAQNDHAIRDQTVSLPWLGKKMIGPGGFRFVRIDNLDPELPVELSQVRAVLQIRDIPQVGSFRCDDERLNRIWQVGAYTVHLNMQEYLWDGIKRDRLVWIGDMHPEVSTINAVFGFNDVVPRSLDLTRDVTPVTEWMNGISSYSMWWVLIHEEWWLHHGNREYLAAQQAYLTALLKRLANLVGPDGKERIDGMRFLDWPSSPNQQGVTAGLQALLVMTLESGSRLMTTLGGHGDGKTLQRGRRARAQGRARHEQIQIRRGAAVAGWHDGRPRRLRTLCSKSAGRRMSPRFTASTCCRRSQNRATRTRRSSSSAPTGARCWTSARRRSGRISTWNGRTMPARIDELVPPGKKDIHGDYGAYCYQGFRHSLCHGWASGPTAWLSQVVLGVKPLEPGCKRVRVAPQLGNLKWAEGKYPTPARPDSRPARA